MPIFMVAYFRRKSGNSEIHKQVRYRRAISFLSCFAAGVFLATCLLDLLPGVRNNLTTVFEAFKVQTKFPIAEFVMTFGLFIILVVEQVVLTFKEKQLISTDVSSRPLLDESEQSDNIRKRNFTRSVSSDVSEHSISGISDRPITPSRRHSGYLDDEEEEEHAHKISHDHQHMHYEEFEHSHSTLRSVLLLMALSLHSLFEGLAVGLQKEKSQVIGIFAALVLHKSILSFSLGMNLVQSQLSRGATLRSVLLFSLSAPIGLAVGIGIINLWDSEASNLVQGILQGIACGTFLYVTFFEVLPHEFNSSDMRLVKIVCLLLGFSTVTCIVFFNNFNH
ncbi:hypothetical protein FSP39_024229 [Pinctada imbricata]|uniref:Uncharacterized protein n=1 Tax=Pinctada imbricata TaxID=66713 RepID=A0AA89BYA4_PINIB|nr:hypothetical protein FSP39_024229 [Pinctada imbricata]